MMQTSTITAAPAIALETGPSEWVLNELMKPFVHEAGHAVIARLLSFPVAWVSVDSEFINNDPLATKNESTCMGPICMTVSSDRLTPILDRGRIVTKADKDTIVGYMMHVMAGPLVECHFDPHSFDRGLSERDFQQALGVLATAEPHKATRKKLYKQACRTLEQLLDEHWSTIMRVAAELHRHRTLMAADLDAIIWGDDMREAA